MDTDRRGRGSRPAVDRTKNDFLGNHDGRGNLAPTKRKQIGDKFGMNKQLPIRRPTRIEGFDYSSPGAYFVTICCQNRNRFFDFPPAKAMVENVWRDISKKFINAEIDIFVVMPDHFHGILILKPNITYPVGEALVASRGVANRDLPETGKREGTSPSPTGNRKIAGLTEIIGAFKSITTWKYSLGVNNDGWPKYYKKIWQRSFYDHIIRNETDLAVLRDYILNNPMELSIEEGK